MLRRIIYSFLPTGASTCLDTSKAQAILDIVRGGGNSRIERLSSAKKSRARIHAKRWAPCDKALRECGWFVSTEFTHLLEIFIDTRAIRRSMQK